LPPEFPKDDPEEQYQGVNIRLKKRLWRELERIAKEEGKSRNYVVEFFLTWAAEDYRAAKNGRNKK